MITVSNHNQRITEVDLSTAPEAIKKGKDFFDKAASMYGNSDTIKKTIDLYISKLNEFAGKKQQANDSAGDAGGAKGKSKKAAASSAAPKASAKRTTPASKPAAKKPTQINTDSTEKKNTVRKKSVKSVNRKVSVAKSVAKKSQRKSVKSVANNRPTKAPVTVKKLSLELQVIKSFAAMNGKTYSAVVFKNKHKQISNYLSDEKIHDHKATILEIKSKLNKVVTSLDEQTATNATINIDKEFAAKCKQIVQSGTVRLRTEFIAGIKPRKTRPVKK